MMHFGNGDKLNNQASASALEPSPTNDTDLNRITAHRRTVGVKSRRGPVIYFPRYTAR